MKHLLNTLFVTSDDVYLALENENVLAKRNDTVLARYPMHTLQSIITFSYAGASPALMGACATKGIALSFCSPQGKFLARTAGIYHGNVLLRREQYRIADDPDKNILIARNMIFGKLYNSRWCLERTIRDHKPRIDEAAFQNAISILKQQLQQTSSVSSLDSLRGIEGVGAAAYFGVFDQMILRDKDLFFFHGRNRRPPLDRINAMLSFAYTILANDIASALESVGLDAYVGFMHQDRSGRKSLALDLLEELRSCFADRFVLTAVNNRLIRGDDFKLNGQSVQMTDTGRK